MLLGIYCCKYISHMLISLSDAAFRQAVIVDKTTDYQLGRLSYLAWEGESGAPSSRLPEVLDMDRVGKRKVSVFLS
jgi:hypothetical protein